MKAITHFFEEAVLSFTDSPYLLEKQNKQWVPLSYSQTREKVYQFAGGLISLGFNQGDRAALLAEGCNKWAISELGVLYAGGINVPLSVKLNEPNDLIFRINHAEVRLLMVSKNQYKKIQPLIQSMKSLEWIVVFEQVDDQSNTILFDQIVEKGKDYLKENFQSFVDRWKSVKPDDIANICYTSGTTADPKGIILTHRNYTANTEQALNVIQIPKGWVTLLVLPWDHAFAHTCGIYTMMKVGATIASVEIGNSPLETLKNIPENIKEIKPHFLMSVPALSKNFRKNIENSIISKGKSIETLFRVGLKIAYLHNGNGFNSGKGWRFLLKPFYQFFDLLIFSKIRAGLGGNLRFFVGGGALLDYELQRFFYAIGLPIYQGYGLTEASPVLSSNSPKLNKMGTSGQIVFPLEWKICDENGQSLPIGQKGEIVVKGENVMAGYWKNPTATSETIKDNWLYTGDLGMVDKEGFLYVYGRSKSLLIADDGEKYSPEGIEEAFVGNSRFIEQTMLYNNQNQYTIALVFPNKEAIKRLINDKHPHLNDKEKTEFALNLIQEEIWQYRNGGKLSELFPQRWLPAAIGILKVGFTEDNHFLNSTLKMVRGKIAEHYSELIQYLYTPEAKNIINKSNILNMDELLK